MADFELNDPVDIRNAEGDTWLPGTITDADAGPDGKCWEVTLSTPVTGDDWQGHTRKNGGSLTTSVIMICKHVETVDEGTLIRDQV